MRFRRVASLGHTCETPKSPPGDYNHAPPRARHPARHPGVKHLNPRQGITTEATLRRCGSMWWGWCETPKSPPGDYNRFRRRRSRRLQCEICVKHLNPRQGITTRGCKLHRLLNRCKRCETPKSPPGDYNRVVARTRIRERTAVTCETPKSPPGDYNVVSILSLLTK